MFNSSLSRPTASLFYNFSITGHSSGSPVGRKDSASQFPHSGGVLNGWVAPSPSTPQVNSFMRMRTLAFVFLFSFSIYFLRPYGIYFDTWHKEGI